MGGVSACTLVLICCSAVLAKLEDPGGARSLQDEVPDSFKVMESFPYTVAIFESNRDNILRCWRAMRAEIDRHARTATFVLAFPATGDIIPFYVKAKENSPEFTFTLQNDTSPKKGKFHYTDYRDCVIEDLEYRGHQCALWVRRALKDNVPQHCIDHYVDACGAVVPEHSRDLCFDSEGDY